MGRRAPEFGKKVELSPEGLALRYPPFQRRGTIIGQGGNDEASWWWVRWDGQSGKDAYAKRFISIIPD